MILRETIMESAKRTRSLCLFFPSLFSISFELAKKFFILPLKEEFFTLPLENYGPHEIPSKHPISILYGIGTFYSHLPTLVRIEWIGTLRLAAEIFLTGRDFCQRNHHCENSCSRKCLGNTSLSKYAIST